MTHSPLWQNLVVACLLVGAVGYLARRWWPTLASLLGRPPQGSPTRACQGQGCKQCGPSGAAPMKDHRITIVRKPPRL